MKPSVATSYRIACKLLAARLFITDDFNPFWSEWICAFTRVKNVNTRQKMIAVKNLLFMMHSVGFFSKIQNKQMRIIHNNITANYLTIRNKYSLSDNQTVLQWEMINLLSSSLFAKKETSVRRLWNKIIHRTHNHSCYT